MLHINKFKFGLKENTHLIRSFTRKDATINDKIIKSPFVKKSKERIKILATIGPKSCTRNSIKKISNYTNLFRLNGSHNNINWHIEVSKKIKEICPNSFILLDIPGLKPRTKNSKEIKIKKNQLITFSYGENQFEKDILSVETTKPLPKINNSIKEFSISDGLFKFVHLKNSKNNIQGISTSNFILKPKKGLNIPLSFYDDVLQEKLYLDFINKSHDIEFDGIGLSFIQNSKILKTIRNKFKNKILVSKIENLYGLNNAGEISKNSDLIMIDRGDLLAEVGTGNFYNSICEISKKALLHNKPLIMATENLESMQKRLQPSKSEIIALEHSIELGTDIIMLSDETATSHLFMNTIGWLFNFLNEKT